MQVRYHDDRIRSGAPVFARRRFGYMAQFSPSRRVAQVAVDGMAGEEIDFANARVGQGILFLGYGDDRELSDQNQLEKTTRQFFVKISYAFQR